MIKRGVRLLFFRLKWRKRNKHNHTTVRRIFSIDKVIVGRETYGSLNIYDYSDPNEQLKIGDFVSISADVKFVLGGNHMMDCISTFPFYKFVFKDRDLSRSKGPIIVESDVWIGMNAVILSGVTIGQGAIVAAGSIVTKDVPPYSIVAGNPAKVIKMRFDDKLRSELLEIDYSKISLEYIKNNREIFEQDLNDRIINRIMVETQR